MLHYHYDFYWTNSNGVLNHTVGRYEGLTIEGCLFFIFGLVGEENLTGILSIKGGSDQAEVLISNRG